MKPCMKSYDARTGKRAHLPKALGDGPVSGTSSTKLCVADGSGTPPEASRRPVPI